MESHALSGDFQERARNGFRGRADLRFSPISFQGDHCPAVVELQDARTSAGSEVVDQRSVSRNCKTDLIAGIEAEHSVAIQKPDLNGDRIFLSAELSETESSRLAPLLRL